MQFSVVYYHMANGRVPVREFLNTLRETQPPLHDLLVAGLTKLEDSQHHGGRLTELVDRDARILELRVGRTNIARIFWCFGQERQTIVALSGYVKQQQALDRGELERARGYKRDMEERVG